MGGEDVPGERSSDPGDLLPLTPVVLNVLLALADGERHGSGIMLAVRERPGARSSQSAKVGLGIWRLSKVPGLVPIDP